MRTREQSIALAAYVTRALKDFDADLGGVKCNEGATWQEDLLTELFYGMFLLEDAGVYHHVVDAIGTARHRALTMRYANVKITAKEVRDLKAMLGDDPRTRLAKFEAFLDAAHAGQEDIVIDSDAETVEIPRAAFDLLMELA